MLQRQIPSSGEALPVIGLGTYRVFDVAADPVVRERLGQVLRTLVAQGGRLIDSSPMYGRAEQTTGDLRARLQPRTSLFLATKVWISGREAGVRQMQESMRRLGLHASQPGTPAAWPHGALDLMQVHNLLDVHTHTATLRQWKARGLVRYLGITHYHSGAHDELARLLATRQYDFLQVNYSIAEREAEQHLLPLAQQLGVAVIANRPFAQAGLLARVRGKPLPAWASELGCATWPQYLLKYVVSHPAITCVIPATASPQHMLDNAMAGSGSLPDRGTRLRMQRHVQQL